MTALQSWREALGRLAARLPGGAAATPPAAASSLPSAPPAEALGAHPDPTLVVVAAPAGGPPRVAYANPAAITVLRVQPGAPLVSSIRHPAVLDTLEETLARGTKGEAVFEAAGPQDRVWRVTAAALPPHETDGLARALLLFRDETDAAARERTAADFLANASHELRTPLASLTGFIETLRGHAREDPEARDRFLAIMADQADRMARLVEDLLSLSRIELNEHVPPQGSVDVSLAASDVVDALSVTSAEREVRLQLTPLARGAAVVEGDRDQIVQVFQNLIDNAVKYSAAGGVVEIEVLAPLSLNDALAPERPGAARAVLLAPVRGEGRRYACVRIRDHGPGLAREHLPRLTERFYRVEARNGPERPGTGLGLAIVKHVINRHRGALTVESLAGAGTVFTACLPLRET